MSIDERKAFRVLIISVAVLLVVVAANAAIDLGAILHDLTHPH